MQKIKKGAFWLVVAILLLPSVLSAFIIPYFDPQDILSFYVQNFLFVDFVLSWLLFGSIARIFVEKKFPGESGKANPAAKPLYVSLGIILSLGLVGLEMQYNFSFLNSGPISIVLLALIVITTLYEAFKKEGADQKGLSWGKVFFTFALVFLAVSFYSPSTISFIGLDFGWMSLAALIAAIGVIYLLITNFWKKGSSSASNSSNNSNNQSSGGGNNNNNSQQNQTPNIPYTPGPNNPNRGTPKRVLDQLATVRGLIETYLKYVNRMAQNPNMQLNRIQASNLIVLFQRTVAAIRTLIRMNDFNQIEARDMQMLLVLFNDFANATIIARRFRVI